MNEKFKILNKHIRSVGEQEKLKKLNSVYREGALELTGTGLSGNYKEWKKFSPSTIFSKVEKDLGVIAETVGFNGKSVWMQDNHGKVTNATTHELLKEFKLQKLLEQFEFANPHSKYFKVSLKNSKEDYLFTIKNTINDTTIEYIISKTTLSLDKKIEHRKDNTRITVFKNYRNIDGIKLPFEINVEIPEFELKEKIKIFKYEFGNFPQSVFTSPKKDAKDFKFLKNNKAENIPFDFSGGHIYLNVNVNGNKGRFILDSGAGKSVIDNGFIKKLGIKKQGIMKVQGISDNADISFAVIKEMKIDNIKLHNQTLITAELSPLFKRATGTIVDGLLGFDFLSRFITKIDFARQLISCYDPETFKYNGSGKKVKAELGENIFFVQVKIEDKFVGNAGVDTGAKGITIFYHFVKKNKLEKRKGLVSIGGGLGALHKAKTVRFKKIEIGGFKINNPLINFPITAVKGAFSAKSKIGNLGTNLFRHFIVYFDYKNNVLILEKGSNYNEKFPENRSGIQFEYSRNKEIIVKFISPDSPAKRSGLKEKDNVISIGDTLVSKFKNLIEIGEFLAGLMGNEVQIIIKRNKKKEALKLNLRDSD